MSSIAEMPLSRPRSFSRPALATLIQLELRKSVDTRAGFWLMAATAILIVIGAVARASTGASADHAFLPVLELATLPIDVLLPVVGILLITSEWSQNTALTTFTQVPGRLRVVLAKGVAALILGFAFFAFAVATTAIVVAAFGSDAPEQWAFGTEMWLQYAVFVTLGMLMGFAFGALLLATTPAIVARYTVPPMVLVLMEFSALQKSLAWIDPTATSEPLVAGPLSSDAALHLLTASAFWIFLPLALGCLRIVRAEIE